MRVFRKINILFTLGFIADFLDQVFRCYRPWAKLGIKFSSIGLKEEFNVKEPGCSEGLALRIYFFKVAFDRALAVVDAEHCLKALAFDRALYLIGLFKSSYDI